MKMDHTLWGPFCPASLVYVMLRHMIMGSDLTVSLVHFVFSLIAVLCHIEGE